MTRRTIVCEVGRSAASRRTAKAAIELARVCGCSLLLVYVRRRPSSIWGTPFYQRRLSREMRRAQDALDGVVRLGGRRRRRGRHGDHRGPGLTGVADFAAARGARLVVGSHGLRPAVAAAAVLRPASASARPR